MEDLEIKPGLVIPGSELQVSFARSSGPGGQNVNKVNSKVVLRFDLLQSAALDDAQKERLRHRIPPRYLTKKGEVVISSDGSRDQDANRTDCLQKLVNALREGLKRPKTRRPTKPSRGSRERRLKAKSEHSQKKQSRKRESW